MKKCLLTATIAVFACWSLIGQAQEGTKSASNAKAAQAEKSDKKSEEAKKGRLPANYGKVGLTEAQKTKIYGIQNQYDDQLDALEKQFAALKGKRDQEVEAVLNDDQRKILKTIAEASKEAKAKLKKGDASGSTSKSESPGSAAPKEEKK